MKCKSVSFWYFNLLNDFSSRFVRIFVRFNDALLLFNYACCSLLRNGCFNPGPYYCINWYKMDKIWLLSLLK